MKVTFSSDYKTVFILNDDGSLSAAPLDSFSDEEKKALYETVARSTYA